MKKLLVILCICTAFLACNNDDENNPRNPVQNLKLPAEGSVFLTGQSATIEGNGFTTESQIWLRAAGTKATGDIQAKVTAVNESSITFEVPEGVEGQQTVILKQNGQEYDLGKLMFKRAEEKLYAYKTYGDTREIVEINIHTGKEKVIATLDDNKTYLETFVFSPSLNFIIDLVGNSLIKLDISSGISTFVELDQDEDTDYDGLVIDDNNSIYAYKRYHPGINEYVKQIVKINIDNGEEQVIATLNFDGTYFETPIFIPTTKEIVGWTDDTLTKVSIIDGTTTVLTLDQNKNCHYYDLTLGY